MSQTASETTAPASYQDGVRTFTVALSPTHHVQIMTAQLLKHDCPEDIHAPAEPFITITDPVKNADLSRALATVLELVTRAPGHDTQLPAA